MAVLYFLKEKETKIMLAKTITYTDYNGEERTETLYFNLSKAELMELEMSVDGGWAERMQKIVDAKDLPTLSRIFKDIILRSYGEKSADGRRFIKSEALSQSFAQSEAYSELFMELLTVDGAAADFMSKIIPQEKKAIPAPADK